MCRFQSIENPVRGPKTTIAHGPASPTRPRTGDYFNLRRNPYPEVIRLDVSDLKVVPDQLYNVYGLPFSDEKMAYHHDEPLASRRRVPGLSPLMFLIVIILAVGIGGGLGAGLSARSKTNGDSRYWKFPSLCR